MKIKVGSRGSKLALAQSRQILSELEQKNPGIEFELIVIKTKGDIIQDVLLHKMNDKGIFVKEIEEALLTKKIDMAVHSMKDMPSTGTKGLKFFGVPKREDPRDAIVFAEGITSISDVPVNGKIGTGSKRRAFQLKRLRPDLDIVPIRGNVDTRIRKITDENLAGVVLAAAGIKRLGLEEKIGQYLEVEEMIPAPTQGILALQIREDDLRMEEILKKIEDEESKEQMMCERAFMEALGGSCHVPMGAYCLLDKEEALIYGVYGDEEGEKLVTKSIKSKRSEIEAAGRELAKILVEELKS